MVSAGLECLEKVGNLKRSGSWQIVRKFNNISKMLRKKRIKLLKKGSVAKTSCIQVCKHGRAFSLVMSIFNQFFDNQLNRVSKNWFFNRLRSRSSDGKSIDTYRYWKVSISIDTSSGIDIYIDTNNCIFFPQFLRSFSKHWRKNSTKFS